MTAPSSYDVIQELVAVYKRHPNFCPCCAWRRHFIRQDKESTDAPPWTCDSLAPHILHPLHQHPDQLWIDIISTRRLCSPVRVFRKDRWWLSFPLRFDNRVQAVQCSDNAYKYEGIDKGPCEDVIGFRNTTLKSLVRGTHISWWGTIGEGILVESRLRYGVCTHDGNSGVNVYSDGGLDTFKGHTGWVSLQVKCTNTKKLNGGADNRYCINGPKNDICYKAVLMNLLVPEEEVPLMAALS